VHPSLGSDDPHGNTAAELTQRLIIPLLTGR